MILRPQAIALFSHRLSSSVSRRRSVRHPKGGGLLASANKFIALKNKKNLGRSIDHRIIVCNVFLTSIFSYLMQFFIIPKVDIADKVRNTLRKLVIPFNGGAFAYIHLVTPTKDMGFKQPLRDLWAAGVSALTSSIDFEPYNGMVHPPLLADKPYLDTHTWLSLHIEDHRDAAALDLLTFEGSKNLEGKVQVSYDGLAKTKRTYRDAVALNFNEAILSKYEVTSLTCKLSRTWGLLGDHAIWLRSNAADIGRWVPAHFRTNHIKLLFNALATDVKRDLHGGNGDDARRALHFPCYMCGGLSDCTLHIYARCEVVRIARNLFLHRTGCLTSNVQLLAEEELATASYAADAFPPKLINALVVFNHAVWDHSRTFFRSLGELPTTALASERIATYASSLWNTAAPKKLRIANGAAGGFFMPAPRPPAVRIRTCLPDPRRNR